MVSKYVLEQSTLKSEIVVLLGITVLVGKLVKKNKCAGGNKNIGGKSFKSPLFDKLFNYVPMHLNVNELLTSVIFQEKISLSY